MVLIGTSPARGTIAWEQIARAAASILRFMLPFRLLLFGAAAFMITLSSTTPGTITPAGQICGMEATGPPDSILPSPALLDRQQPAQTLTIHVMPCVEPKRPWRAREDIAGTLTWRSTTIRSHGPPASSRRTRADDRVCIRSQHPADAVDRA